MRPATFAHADVRMSGTRSGWLLEANNLVAPHLDGGTPIGRRDAMQHPDGHTFWLLLHDLAGKVHHRPWRLRFDSQDRLFLVDFHSAAFGQL
jgi:hypothetical protein